MLNISNKNVFVFDWDGTIFNSMEIKRMTFTDSFFESISFEKGTIPDRNYVYDMYVKLSGVARKEIFSSILKSLGIPFNIEIYDKFNVNLTTENKKKLLTCSVFEDAILFMKKILSKNGTIYLSSSVPMLELSYLTHNKINSEIFNNIQAIYGSSDTFKKGAEHFDSIIDETKCRKQDIIFFGDDYMDLVLCNKYGIDCILIDRNHLMKQEINIVNSFREIKID